MHRLTLFNVHQFSLPCTSYINFWAFCFHILSVYVVVVVAAWRQGLDSVLIRFRSNSKTKNPLDAWWDSMKRRKAPSQGLCRTQNIPSRLVSTRITTLPPHLWYFFHVRLTLKPLKCMSTACIYDCVRLSRWPRCSPIHFWFCPVQIV
jgi:hypothetical protein